MSKIGKKNIVIPKESSVKIEGSNLTFTGPKGTKKLTINDKIFSSGYDISSIKEDYNDLNHPLIKITNHIKNSGKIVVTAINGHIFGGALEIAISSDFRFFSKNAIFCVPPARLGIPYSYQGLKNFINCIGISNTKKIFLTADKFNSNDALEMGIANFISENSETIEEVYEPFLIQQGFIIRTPRGRQVTEKGYNHLGRNKNNQNNLFN